MNYEPSQNVISFHGVPRFGFSSDRMAVLFTDDDSLKDEYVDGIMYFSIMLLALFSLWILALLALKIYYGRDKVGFLAGGEPIDIAKLRYQGVRRWERNCRMRRSFSVQNVFLICCFGIPSFSAVLVNRGLDPLLESLIEVSEISKSFRSKAQYGIRIAKTLQAEYAELVSLSGLDLDLHCPLHNNSPLSQELEFQGTLEKIEEVENEVGSFLEGGVDKFLHSMHELTDASDGVQSGVDHLETNEWLIRIFLLLMNSFTFSMAIGAVLAKNQVNHSFAQSILVVVQSSFLLSLVAVVTSTCLVASFSILDADFCMGNDQQTSPIGTLQDFAFLQNYDKDSMMLQLIDYYSKDSCNGHFPMDILSTLISKVEEALDLITPILDASYNNKQDIFDSECGSDTSIMLNSLSTIKTSLSGISSQLNESSEATSCNGIRPLLRDLVYGAPCTDTVDGFTWMFSSLMTMSILGLIMFTTRAAMYNPIIASSKGRRREKEFKQYKEFMKNKGYDTSEWRMDPKRKTLHMNLYGINTFETEDSGSKSGASPTSITSSEAGAAEWDDEESSPGLSKGEQVPVFQEDAPKAEYTNIALNTISEDDVSDQGSVYSFDSDDSSINPPPSLLSSVKSNFSTIVSTLRISPRNSEGPVYEDTPSPANREVPMLTLPVPVRQQQYHEKIASHFGKDDRSVGESSISSSHRGSNSSDLDSVQCEGGNESFREADILYFSDTASQRSTSSHRSTASHNSTGTHRSTQSHRSTASYRSTQSHQSTGSRRSRSSRGSNVSQRSSASKGSTMSRRSSSSSHSTKIHGIPKAQPGAPQKSMSSLARTIVNV